MKNYLMCAYSGKGMKVDMQTVFKMKTVNNILTFLLNTLSHWFTFQVACNIINKNGIANNILFLDSTYHFPTKNTPYG